LNGNIFFLPKVQGQGASGAITTSRSFGSSELRLIDFLVLLHQSKSTGGSLLKGSIQTKAPKLKDMRFAISEVRFNDW